MPSALIRLVLATVLGGLVGVERAMKRRPAGLRTFCLVSLGSALAMVTNQYLTQRYGDTVDPSRLAAQVISGIGFLGVGTIVITGKNYVHGLTTAASLWVTATMGIAIGAGFIWGGLVTFTLIMIAVRLLSRVSRKQEQFNRMFGVYMEIDRSGMDKILDYIKENGYSISYMEKKRKGAISNRDIPIHLEIDLHKRMDHDRIMGDFTTLEVVHYIEEIK